MSARVLVLGGDGMLGRMIRSYLATAPGLAVDWTSRQDNQNALRFRADTAQSLIGLAKERGGYDFVVNCIASLRSGPDSGSLSDETSAAYFVNAIFPHELARITAELGCKLLHVSTDAVFGATAGRCTESDTPVPSDAYGRSKLLGEPLSATNTLTIRCSIIGPNPAKKAGLFEWVLGQPSRATIKGYQDQLWCGATTLQFARLCERLFQNETFQTLRGESSVHHFCPNEPVTKFELACLICWRFRPDVTVDRATGGTVTRVLDMGGMLRTIYGPSRPMAIAIDELSTYIDRPKPALG